MKITFLGTGTSFGVPVINCDCVVCSSDNPKDKRMRTSIFVQHDDHNFIIDVGPDFRQQAMLFNIKRLDAIFFTHEHADHVSGMDEIRPFSKNQNKPIDIFVQPRVYEALVNRYEYIFGKKKYPGIPHFNINLVDEHQEFNIGNLIVKVLPIKHGDLDIVGYKIGDIVYITDASYINDDTLDQIRNCKLLILNALRIEKHYTHFSLDEAVQITDRIKPKFCYFIHMSHHIGLHDYVNANLGSNIQLAYDGLIIDTNHL